MSEEYRTFSATIILELTDRANMFELHIPLMPSDSVLVDGIHVKQLQDCTLSELRQYAQDLEEDWWSEVAHKSVRELLLDQGVTVIIEDQTMEGRSSHIDYLSFTVQVEPITDDTEDNEVEDEKLGHDETLERAVGESSEQDLVPSWETETSHADENSALLPDSIGDEIGTLEDKRSNLIHDDVLEKEFRLMGMRRPQNHPTWAAVDILISESAFRDTQAHAVSSLDREVAGVLVGPPPEKQPDGRYVVYISDSIIAKHTRMEGASVTYTPESWRYVNDRLDELFVDNSAVIVGWYHTHPGFGIFLSGMDRFIHRHFFTQIWHVAFVLDPLANKSGFFCWNREQTNVDSYPFPWPEWANASW